MRAEPSATSAEQSSGRIGRLAVWSVSDKNNVSSQRWKLGLKRGTIDPGVMVRRSRFETTALEMPAGFGLTHHRANLARDGWPGPHLRTGDVTRSSPPMKPVPTYELLLWERPLQQIPLHVFKPAGDFPAKVEHNYRGTSNQSMLSLLCH